ncbi:unnamed protein product [Urochloa humidicola]
MVLLGIASSEQGAITKWFYESQAFNLRLPRIKRKQSCFKHIIHSYGVTTMELKLFNDNYDVFSVRQS